MPSYIDKTVMVLPEQALPGRKTAVAVLSNHYVNGRTMLDEDGALLLHEDEQLAVFGMGCFWGAERKFWQLDGVTVTAVGYTGGFTPNPSYEEVCSGLTGHNEVVAVVFNTTQTDYSVMLKCFWENHNPTQGMRQGNDVGTQYRSGIYCYSEQQLQLAKESKAKYQTALNSAASSGIPKPIITTEIVAATPLYFAESYHQQYLAKNPQGYCGLGGCNIPYPM